MGWASYHVEGKIDRQKEAKSYYETEDEKVLKMVVKGNVVYAAIGYLNTQGEQVVFASVSLTETNPTAFHNFSYKIIDESAGPFESECPASILKLLTPTDNIHANGWRERCWDNVRNREQKKKDPNSLNNLPVGAKIEMPHPSTKGDVTLTKYVPRGKKLAIWVNETITLEYPKSLIERMGYQVVSTL